jgi:hypothetical protein
MEMAAGFWLGFEPIFDMTWGATAPASGSIDSTTANKAVSDRGMDGSGSILQSSLVGFALVVQRVLTPSLMADTS